MNVPSSSSTPESQELISTPWKVTEVSAEGFSSAH